MNVEHIVLLVNDNACRGVFLQKYFVDYFRNVEWLGRTAFRLAARLCGEAKPGQILVPRRFLGTVEDLVEAEPAGELSLKGFHRPIPAYNILRLKG